ncbi:TPA: hypothetical protein ACKP1B_002885 [Serratia fonticola]
MKGSVHIVFRKPELIDRVNGILENYYPSMIAAR